MREENAAMKKRLAELEAKDEEREARLTKLEQFISETPKGRSRHGGIEEGQTQPGKRFPASGHLFVLPASARARR